MKKNIDNVATLMKFTISVKIESCRFTHSLKKKKWGKTTFIPDKKQLLKPLTSVDILSNTIQILVLEISVFFPI